MDDSARLGARHVLHANDSAFTQFVDDFCEVEVHVADAGAFGGPSEVEGREAILTFFDTDVFPRFALMIHTGHNPEIMVDGDEATGLWTYDSYQLTTGEEPLASWHGGFYEDRYRRVQGRWLITYMRGEHAFNYVTTDGLWAADRPQWPPPLTSGY